MSNTLDGCCGPLNPVVASPPAFRAMASAPPGCSSTYSVKSYTLPSMITHRSSRAACFGDVFSRVRRRAIDGRARRRRDGARASSSIVQLLRDKVQNHRDDERARDEQRRGRRRGRERRLAHRRAPGGVARARPASTTTRRFVSPITPRRMSDDDEARADARALAVALAQRDCETLFARCARADGAVTLDEDAQARLARALEISSKFSKSYAVRVARAACKAIAAAGLALDDALAAALHARDDEAWERERDGWRDCVYAYERATRREDDARSRAIDAREMNARTALGTRDVDAIRARTQSDALAGSTGAFAWPAGFVASEFVMSRLASEALVRGRAVVELGSGVGVAGVAMARCAPAALVLTDRDAQTLENLRDNVRLNVDMDGDGATRVVFDALDAPVAKRSTPDEALVVSVRDLDWERAPVEVLGAVNADFVLAADCSYDPTLIPGLVRALRALLRARGADDESAPTTLETLEASRAREVIRDRYARTPCAFVVSAVRQATTMDVLIDALERARLHPVDVTSAIAASREPAFLFADAARGHARDAFRAFACSATRVA